jgi:hypothetical protein
MCAEASTILRAVAADFFFNCWCLVIRGASGSVVVKALCYKPEGREFDTR